MKKRYSIIMFVVMMFVFVLLPVQIFAAKTVTVLDEKVSITDSSGNGSGDAAKYTATAQGNMFSKKSNTITITNETDAKAQIEFDYTAETASSFKIAGSTANLKGSYSATLESGGKIEIVLTSNSGFSNTTATLTLTNIAYTEVSDSSKIAIVYENSSGSVTAGGEAIESGSSITVEGDGTELVATPSSGNVFVAWAEESGKLLSKNAVYNLKAIGNKTIKAIFSNNTPYFIVDNNYVFEALDDAMEDAEAKATSKPITVVLACNGILPEGDYVIPSGVTLLIPFDAGATLYTTAPEGVQDYTKPSAYRTLTMASGASITVNGAISVSAKHSSKQGSTGSPTGKYGHINMKENSSITVTDGGNLYAWGFITGNGNITAESGATIYECFQIADWRGGNAIINMIENDNEVFPMSQYYVQNIEVPLMLEAGAVENGYMSAYVSGMEYVGQNNIQSTEIPFIGPNGMFRMQNGHITKDYNEENDRLIIDIDNGTLNMASLSLSMKLSILGTQTINSSSYTLPVNGNITLNVNAGSTVTINQDMALLPGGVINVCEGAFCNIIEGTNVFIYDSDEWGGYTYKNNSVFMPVIFAPGKTYTRTEENDIVDARINIAGEVNALDGFVYVTESGANIIGADGGKVQLKTGNKNVTYQATQSNTDISYSSIPVVSAKLKNADGQYAEMLGDCCTAYTYSDGKWIPDEAAIKHTSIVTEDGAEPTCTEDGYSESSYCSACGTVIEAKEAIPSSGHKFSTEWTTDIEPTHKDSGEKSHHCLNCSEKADVTIIDALGHSFDNWTKVDGVNHKGECACGEIETEAHNFVGLNCLKCGSEKIVTNTIYDIKEGNLEIDTSLILEVSPDTQIIIATYDSYGKLLKASAFAAELLEKVILPADGVAKIKVFAWNGFEGVAPVSGVEEIILGGE